MPTKKIKFKKEMFCPMYWYAGAAIEDHEIRYVFSYGGSSASKTYSIVQKICTETIDKNIDTIVMRKYAADIDRSIYKDFQLVVKDWGLEEFFIFQKHKIKCINGAVIEFTGLDDPEKIKGITGFTYAIMEEFNQFDLEDFKQMRNRMRGLPNQTIICIWNPIDETHWVKKDVIDKYTWSNYNLTDKLPESYDDMTGYLHDIKIQTSQINKQKNAVLLHTNYKDNWYISGHPNGLDGRLDKHTLDNFEEMREHDYEYYRVYALGLWGRADRGDEFYKNFDSKRHVLPNIEVDIAAPLHISFDENVNPYLTLTIWQAAGRVARQVGEICNKNPRNTLDKTLYDFYRDYPPNRGNKNIYLYGDSTSRKEDVKQEKGKDFYTIIENILEGYGYNVRRRVPSKNPNVQIRGGFINKILSKRGFMGIDIKASSLCVKSIEDWMYVKEDQDGTKFKKMVKDPVTEVRYQKNGHTSDANDYFILEYFKNEFHTYIHGDNKLEETAIPRFHKFHY